MLIILKTKIPDLEDIYRNFLARFIKILEDPAFVQRVLQSGHLEMRTKLLSLLKKMIFLMPTD
jgi:hypothetical protein